MRLLHRDFSPQSAQVRMLIYAHALPVTLEAVQDPELAQSLAALPLLELEGGDRLSDAAAIMDFLSASFLAGAHDGSVQDSALNSARLREKANLAHNQLAAVLLPLFLKIKYPGLDANPPCYYVDHLRIVLARLDALLRKAGVSRSARPDVADCALLPMLLFSQWLPVYFQQPDPVADFSAVVDWWEGARTWPATERVIYELQRGFQTYLADL